MVARLVDARERADARCPGVVHAVAALDGGLVRIRIPGGFLVAAQLDALADAADAFADGRLDITARASVQLRGVAFDRTHALGEALVAAGLLPSLEHDRVRNIVASPFAGIDAAERIDTRPIVRALDAALIADPTLAALPAKFAFAIDGGGMPFPNARPDITLRAEASADERRLRVLIAGAPAGAAVAPDAAAAFACDLARAALVAATAAGEPETWRLATSAAAREAAHAAMRRSPLARLAATTPPSSAESGNASPAIPLGVVAAPDTERCAVVPSIPLGRLSSAQARVVAALARSGRDDLRLGWWRGIVLADLPRAHAADVVASLAACGLPCDGSDGFQGIAACAGSAGCEASLADVRGDAAALAQAIAGHGTSGRTANLAGCAKRCAMRRGATIDLVATPHGYEILRAGVVVHADASAADALAFARATLLSEPR